MTNTTAHLPKREWHGIHHSWSYRPHAFRWAGERIAGLNLQPLASEMLAWMMQLGQLALMSAPEAPTSGGFTNPYTVSGVTLQLLMARIINASHEYATTDTPNHNEIDAEVERIRLYNEVLMYLARFCEVAIKQLLFGGMTILISTMKPIMKMHNKAVKLVHYRSLGQPTLRYGCLFLRR